MTAPPSVEIAPPPPSSSFSRVSWAARLAVDQSDCTLRVGQRPFGDLRRQLAEPAGRRPGEPRQFRRQLLRQFGPHVDVGEELVGR